MKNNQLTSVLIALLFLSTATTGWLMYKYDESMHRIRELDPKLREVAAAENIFQQILNDTIAYDNATKNPDMTRLLQSMNQKAAAPSGKPATK